MTHKQCFKCDDLIDGIDYNIVALDNPYVNLFFHRSCYIELGEYGGVIEYITLNPKLCYTYIGKQPIKVRK